MELGSLAFTPNHRISAFAQNLSGHADLGLGPVEDLSGVNARSVVRSETTEQSEDNKDGEEDDRDATENGAAVAKVGPLAASLAGVALDGLSAKLVVNHATESDAVAEELGEGNLAAVDDHGSNDEQNVLEDTAEGEDERRGLANQEHNGDVEAESAKAVQEEVEEADAVDISHGKSRDLPEKSNDAVHEGADGSEVVERNQGIHLELGGAQETLDHGKTEGFEGNTSDLEDDTQPDELELAVRSDNDTDNDNGHVKENPQVDRRYTKGPAGEENSDGGSGLDSKGQSLAYVDSVAKRIFGTDLEHLDEGNAEIEIGEVAADQTQAEEETDRDNGAQIDLASHLNRLPAIEQCGIPSKDLGHDSRENQMISGQHDREICIVVLASVLPATVPFPSCISGYPYRSPLRTESIC